MQLQNPSSNSVPDFSFPWSMAEEKGRGTDSGANPTRKVPFSLEEAEPSDSLPIAFRTWMLEHQDELTRH